MVGRNTEIVLHDLTKPESSVIDIVNGHLSGRSIGSSVLSGPKQDLGFKAVIKSAACVAGKDPVILPNYQTTTGDGRVFDSSTVVFRDANFFSQGFPARSVVSCKLAFDLDVEIEVQAFLNQGS